MEAVDAAAPEVVVAPEVAVAARALAWALA